jgi:DNA-binding CsgD family transcriptional regulator
VIAREQATRVWRLVERLSMRERSVFLLRYVEDLELNEIGQRIGIKASAVKSYLRRAQTKIRAELRRPKLLKTEEIVWLELPHMERVTQPNERRILSGSATQK